MTRTILAATLILIAATALAQPAVNLERIDVKATRARPQIIIAETRLRTGRSYTTEEIEQAVYRVRRLPFVAGATYVLEPGVAPGANVLRITVFDELPFHVVLDAQALAQRGGYVSYISQFGVRFFPTRSGSLDLTDGGAGVSANGGGGSHLGDLSVQYTGYGLFGTSAYAGIGVTRHASGGDRLMSPLLLLGIPLTQTQTLRGTYARSGNKQDNNSLATAEWLMETSDDPYFPHRGWSVAAGPQWERFVFLSDLTFGSHGPGAPPPTIVHFDDRLKGTGFALDAEKYWPKGEHGALWGRANGVYFNETTTHNGTKGIPAHRQLGDALIGAAWNFDSGVTDETFHRGRVELGAGYHREYTAQAGHATDRSGAEIFVGAAYRNRLGVVRLRLTRVSSKR
jgi:hypothetical protein